MRIRLAKTAGFCMGVRRAVDMALDLRRLSPPLPIVTYGPLIHNPQTLELLESRGIKKVDSLDSIRGGTVVIRAHGISPRERGELEKKGVGIIDATCPRVARVQAVIRKHAKRGHFCFIVGDKDHPEVRGLIGFASSGGTAVASCMDKESMECVEADREICVVAQTTQESETFAEVVNQLKKRYDRIHVYNTICDSTRKRQSEVRRLGETADFIVVVGGKGSGNTQRLVKVAESQGVPALHVETPEEIPASALTGVETVGVTAGASTPNWQIQSVIDRLKEIGMSRARGPLRRLRRLLDISVMTYVGAAFGGGGLTATCMVLQGREVSLLPPAVAMLFVFSMHLINRILERTGAVRFNTPEIAAFYAKHRRLLSGIGSMSTISALVLGWWLGAYAFALLAAMVAGGLLYTGPVMVGRLPSRRWQSPKDIPGSKTPLVAMGWAMAAAVLPVAGSAAAIDAKALAVAVVFSAGMVFWRTALSDLLDIQGDRIVGRETIPILIGVERCGYLLAILLAFLSVLVAVASAVGWTTGMGFWLLINTTVYGIFFVLYKKRYLADRLSLEGMLDANLMAAGAVSILYGAV